MSDRLRNWQIKPIVTQHTGWKTTAPEQINPEIIVARAGTRVVCPKCSAFIGRLRSDLYSGVSCRADQIEFAPGQLRHPNELAECKACRPKDGAPGTGTGYMQMRKSAKQPVPRIFLHVEIDGRLMWI